MWPTLGVGTILAVTPSQEEMSMVRALWGRTQLHSLLQILLLATCAPAYGLARPQHVCQGNGPAGWQGMGEAAMLVKLPEPASW